MRADWRLETLGSIAEFRGGGTPSTENATYWGGGIPWVSPKDMKSEQIGSSIDTITAEAISNSAVSIIPAGSILIVVRSGILARTIPTALTTCDLTVNQDIKALTPLKSVNNRFLHYFLQSMEPTILKLVTTGATVHRLSTESIKRLPILLPSISEQNIIVDKLDRLRSETSRLQAIYQQKLTSLVDLKQAILHKALAGELTSKDVKTLIEAAE